MKTAISAPGFSLSRMYCSVFGHNFRLSKEVTPHIKEYTCTHCKKEATTSLKGKIELMTPMLKEINVMLTEVQAKRNARRASHTSYKVAS